MGRTCEAAVAGAADTSARERGAGSRMCEIGEQPALLVEHLRPEGHVQLDVVSFGTVAIRALPVSTTACREAALAREEGEIPEIRVSGDDDVASVASVAAVRTALRDVLLAPEAERAVAAAASDYLDAGPVVEHGRLGGLGGTSLVAGVR